MPLGVPMGIALANWDPDAAMPNPAATENAIIILRIRASLLHVLLTKLGGIGSAERRRGADNGSRLLLLAV
jgi:hypothetical protein